MWNTPSDPRVIDGSRISFDSPTTGASNGLSPFNAVQCSPSRLSARNKPVSPFPRKNENTSTAPRKKLTLA
jgi:hypothetical protein